MSFQLLSKSCRSVWLYAVEMLKHTHKKVQTNIVRIGDDGVERKLARKCQQNGNPPIEGFGTCYKKTERRSLEA